MDCFCAKINSLLLTLHTVLAFDWLTINIFEIFCSHLFIDPFDGRRRNLALAVHANFEHALLIYLMQENTRCIHFKTGCCVCGIVERVH